jgi:DNA-binding Lrp family transcriptional regulator
VVTGVEPRAYRADPPAGTYHESGSRDEEAAMAVSAYVLIQTEVGKAAQVVSEVAKIEGVVSAEDVTGPYDVIVRAQAGSVDELGKMVVSRVQLIEGITRTLTCPVVNL